MMNAIYFDGKTSKPHQVAVSRSMDGLMIQAVNTSDFKPVYWKQDGITTKSFSTGKKVLLSYGEFPYQRLELTGAGVDSFMESALENESLVKKYEHRITRTGPIQLVLGSILVLGLVIYSYAFHISPYVGEQAVKLVPKSVEVKVGEVSYQNMSYMIDLDTSKSQLLLDFYQACGFQSEYDIRIDYSKNDMVNAFAVPGGQIVVFEGLIRETECWDELAALMGHELAHVNERHSFKQLARSVTSYLLLSVLTGDVGGASGVLLEQANNIHEMSNSRKHEREADEVGLAYLREARIRPTAMMDLFSRLMEETGEEEMVEEIGAKMEYLSTHPLSSNRIKYIEELIESDVSYDYEPLVNEKAEVIWNQLKVNTDKSLELKLIDKIKKKLKGRDEDGDE